MQPGQAHSSAQDRENTATVTSSDVSPPIRGPPEIGKGFRLQALAGNPPGAGEESMMGPSEGPLAKP